ncbi:hypothetical protein K2173_009124 [Erythroxylum novogranatense]|uniref:J domain-containing protein n=1 Tax=Erythroxylum novogranatense TaxID=1862640 RepID=A0AAV8TD62_9ROSI|nr:hypothetical protein K2173_009124 [Erythroxylum novogranatense]
MASPSYRLDAERWLNAAEKLLGARDLHAAKSFATRVRESDPRLLDYADQIIAVAETILAGELRVHSGNHDYYAILQLNRLTQSMDLIANQYRKLAVTLNPTRNTLPFVDQAFKLVSEAWFVFSNPSKKAMYDHELRMSQLGQQLDPYNNNVHNKDQNNQNQFGQVPGSEPPEMRFRAVSGVTVVQSPVAQPSAPVPTRGTTLPKSTESPRHPIPPLNADEPTRPSAFRATAVPNRTAAQAAATGSTHRNKTQTRPSETVSEVPSFWTACPYCFFLYEYPKVYEGCALKCQNCKRSFHASVIPSPPLTDKDQYFCSWGFFPVGFSGDNGKNLGGSGWSPISAMFATPLQAGGMKSTKPTKPKVIYKDDDFINLSDSSEQDSDDDEWDSRKKKAKNSRGRGTPSKIARKSQNERAKKGSSQNVNSGVNVQDKALGKEEGTSGKKKKGAKDLGELDLNVMFSNEVEEQVPTAREQNGTGNEEEDNISGIAFFEGLDEFLSSLPILSVVGDDKAKAN